MIQLQLDATRESPLQVLCLGAHSDDIEIGCGGTILDLQRRYPACRFTWAVFSAIGTRREEAERAAAAFAGQARLDHLLLRDFRDGFMPWSGAEVKAAFEQLKELVSPDLIFTHQSHDAHQDHRLLSELTWNTFRNHLILEYEIPKYDGDLGRPSIFIPLEEAICRQKTRLLMDCFISQRQKHWFTESTFQALLRLRGIECNAADGYAEAFYCRKAVL